MTDAKRDQADSNAQPPGRAPAGTQKPESGGQTDTRNEGEGSRTAAKQYNEATRAFVESGRVDAQAESARRAVEGSERAELERAEQAGRARAKEEDPDVKRDDKGR